MMPTDAEIVEWVRSGSREQIAQAITYLYSLPEFIGRVRRRCKYVLRERQILYPEQSCYRIDAENEVEAWIFEKAFSPQTLPRTILESGGGFDPELGSLCRWLYQAAIYQLRDWVKQNCKPVREVARGGPEHEFAQHAEIRSPVEQPDLQKRQSQETQVGWREVFAKVLKGKMQRASMLTKHIGEFEVFSDDDLNCFKEVRKLSNDTYLQIQQDFQLMWQKIVGRTTGKQTNSDDADPDPLVGYRKIEAQVTMLFIKLQHKYADQAYFARRLIQIGHSEVELVRLEIEAQRMTLAEIKEKYKNRWSDERSFAEASHRAHKIQQQLAKAQVNLEAKDEFPGPRPKEIAEFLNSTPNAVSSALTYAEQKISQYYFGKEPPADARVP